MAAAHDHSIHIVLVDDDEVDAEAVARLLQKHHLPHRLTVFPDGQTAQLALTGPFGRDLRTHRYIILLDLNMPRVSGFEFLDWLRTQPDLAHSIVFVFSTSEEPIDFYQADRWHVAGYLAKSRLGP